MRLLSLSLFAPFWFIVAGCSATATAGDGSPTRATPVEDAGVTAPSDGGVSTTPDAQAPAADAAKPVAFGEPTSVSPVCDVDKRYSAYGEGDFSDGLYVVAVAPTVYPYLVESISYTLKAGMVINPDNGATVSCLTSTQHKLAFFKGAGGVPSASPSDLQTWMSSGFTEDRTEKLPKAVTLEQGEVGYVAIQMVRSFSANCVRACDAPPTPGIHFRAERTSAPFTWSSFVPRGNLLMTMNGRPVLR